MLPESDAFYMNTTALKSMFNYSFLQQHLQLLNMLLNCRGRNSRVSYRNYGSWSGKKSVPTSDPYEKTKYNNKKIQILPLPRTIYYSNCYKYTIIIIVKYKCKEYIYIK